jgi:hypothetical protein
MLKEIKEKKAASYLKTPISKSNLQTEKKDDDHE